MIATALLGIAAAGVILPFSSGAAVQAEGTRRTLAAKLASDLLEQIIHKPFHDPDGSSYYYNAGPDAGETAVEDFDNIDDFHGYAESQGQVKDATWTVFSDTNYSRFSRDVSCAYVYAPPQAGTVPANFIRVTVRVYSNGDEIAVENRLVSRQD